MVKGHVTFQIKLGALKVQGPWIDLCKISLIKLCACISTTYPIFAKDAYL